MSPRVRKLYDRFRRLTMKDGPMRSEHYTDMYRRLEKIRQARIEYETALILEKRQGGDRG